MQLKALWGFEGNAEKLGTGSSRVRRGEVVDVDDAEYAHLLLGKGLVEQFDAEAEAKAQAEAEAKAQAEAEAKAQAEAEAKAQAKPKEKAATGELELKQASPDENK